MRYFLRLLPALFLLAPSCADDDLQPRRNETDLEALDRLVPITQTGAGTFGCLLNGELWISEAVFEEEAADAGVWTTNPNSLTITADKQPISDDRDQLLVVGSVFVVGSKSRLKSLSGWGDATVTEGECGLLNVDSLMENYMLVNHFDQTKEQ